ncbi:MAG: hypothetical protein R3211_10225, partial [Balneolaceae bacterium]|nr:hypothetical protein [Balneolaceae bacterium]
CYRIAVQVTSNFQQILNKWLLALARIIFQDDKLGVITTYYSLVNSVPSCHAELDSASAFESQCR